MEASQSNEIQRQYWVYILVGPNAEFQPKVNVSAQQQMKAHNSILDSLI